MHGPGRPRGRGSRAPSCRASQGVRARTPPRGGGRTRQELRFPVSPKPVGRGAAGPANEPNGPVPRGQTASQEYSGAGHDRGRCRTRERLPPGGIRPETAASSRRSAQQHHRSKAFQRWGRTSSPNRRGGKHGRRQDRVRSEGGCEHEEPGVHGRDRIRHGRGGHDAESRFHERAALARAGLRRVAILRPILRTRIVIRAARRRRTRGIRVRSLDAGQDAARAHAPDRRSDREQEREDAGAEIHVPGAYPRRGSAATTMSRAGGIQRGVPPRSPRGGEARRGPPARKARAAPRREDGTGAATSAASSSGRSARASLRPPWASARPRRSG